ncbi:DNA topoisomerase 4 subunit A [Aliidongia dinghuensis]|uniref:DNA topoisomerase 4 subunit A n=1 Tax=Aliidongia dinghuensis TaxID=1867774 RepID=A0A8J3E661_9PROT|nr:DNA topoisomerase IV subunit A [Aliidongia dinghuensis]GGF40994.1 DNA topoisomerase 4 subunit A [Aliidongia dinghuensis]
MASTSAAGEIRDTELHDALSERYLSYALSTIMARSLPDVRDGLKPVHRRILWAMRQLRLDPDAGYKKCARVVGDVIGKYHPHGDASIYEALVRLAQDFAQRYPLVDGQGNFGNVDGDNAAAMRYTESRLTIVARALMDGIDNDTVDFRSTYDGEGEEPVVLPSRFPNLLANGATGIAVGMATSIPPHNVGELCDGLRLMIAHPDCSLEALTEVVRGPDFPTGGVLVETEENIRQAYATGRGSFRLRARWEKEPLPLGAYQIVVTEIPYMVPKARLIEKIAELLEEKKLPLLADIREESAEQIRLVFEPKTRNVDPDVLMESLFRSTDLEVRIPLNLNVLDAEGVPRVMSVKEALREFLDHRLVVLERRSRNRLEAIGRRMEILRGQMVVYLNLDEVIRIIREADHPKTALMERFELTELQADAILNLRLRALHKLEQLAIQKEIDDLAVEATGLEALLADESLRWAAIDEEVLEMKEEFGPHTELGRRRTELGGAPSAVVVPVHALVEREPVTVLCSEKGWIRAVKGHNVPLADQRYKEGDGPRFAVETQTTDRLLVFASNGRFFTVGIDKLPGGRGHGEPLKLMIDLPNEAEIVALRPYRPGEKLMLVSTDGRGFVVNQDEAQAQTRAGKQVMNPAEGATARFCLPFTGDALALVGDNRKLLVLPLAEIPEMSKGRGVILQKYKDGGLADAKVIVLAEGLSWPAGSRVRSEPDLTAWKTGRGSSGRMVPTGFPRPTRFES